MIRHKSRKRSALWSVGMAGSALLAAITLAGCGGTGGGGGVDMHAVLNGAQEVPQVNTTAAGTARVELDPDNDLIRVSLTTTGLNNVVAAHIHHGPPSADGPVMFTLYAPADGAFPSTLVKTLTAADFTPVPGVGTFNDALGVIRGGASYINVHTTAHTDGEIRGQIIR